MLLAEKSDLMVKSVLCALPEYVKIQPIIIMTLYNALFSIEYITVKQ